MAERNDPVSDPDANRPADPNAGPGAVLPAAPPAGAPGAMVPVAFEAVPVSVGPRVLPLPRGLIILLGLAAGIIVIFGMRQVASILAPMFMALCLTITVYPVRTWLVRKGWPGWLATLVLVLATVGALVILIVGLIWSIARFATILPDYAGQMQQTIAELKNWVAGLGIGREQIQEMIGKIDAGQIVALTGAVLSSVLNAMTALVFIITLILFMSVDGAAFPSRMEKVRAGRASALAALGSFATGTRKYFAVSTVFGAIVAILDGIALIFFGIPGPVLWAILAFITNYIPNVGFIIGLVPVALLGLLTGGFGTMIGIVVVYCLLNFIIQSVIQPKYVGDSVGLTTTVTFLSLIVWAFVLGPLGAILAVPMTLLAKALLVDADPDARWLQLFLGDEPVHDKPPKAPREHWYALRRRPLEPGADLGAAASAGAARPAAGT